MKFVIYRDQRRQWRWRLIATNGKIIADSAESYKRRRSPVNAIRRIQRLAFKAKVIG